MISRASSLNNKTEMRRTWSASRRTLVSAHASILFAFVQSFHSSTVRTWYPWLLCRDTNYRHLPPNLSLIYKIKYIYIFTYTFCGDRREKPKRQQGICKISEREHQTFISQRAEVSVRSRRGQISYKAATPGHHFGSTPTQQHQPRVLCGHWTALPVPGARARAR